MKGDLKSCVEELEKEIISARMKNYRNSRELAKALGIDKSTLNRKIKKYGITSEFIKIDNGRKKAPAAHRCVQNND